MSKKTAEQRASLRFDKEQSYTDFHNHHGYLACIREQVEPLEEWKESAIIVMGEWDKVHEALGKPGKLGESMAAASLAELAKLRALVQTLVNGLHAVSALADVDTDERSTIARDPLDAAKQSGFVPTNTQDNG